VISRSLHFELYELAITLADRFNKTPFDIFAQDCEEVISYINHVLEKDGYEQREHEVAHSNKNDGFWDNM
jgi:hypothetical protein